jgi:hypothetical protein
VPVYADFCCFGAFADFLNKTFEYFPRFLHTHQSVTGTVVFRLIRHFFSTFQDSRQRNKFLFVVEVPKHNDDGHERGPGEGEAERHA